jgi:hypothetical protein
LVLRIPESALDYLLEHPRATMGLEAKDVERLIGKLAANKIGQRPHLAGADSREFVYCSVRH